jgi:hypothetical protein
MFNELQQEWVPLDDAVFQLTPPGFHAQADTHYESLGHPAVSQGRLWSVYSALLDCFCSSLEDMSLQDAFHLANQLVLMTRWN